MEINKDPKLQIQRKIFNEVDPVGIFFGENENEYDPEIKELLSRDADYGNLANLNRDIKEIFAKYFEGVKINEDLLSELAKRIHKNH